MTVDEYVTFIEYFDVSIITPVTVYLCDFSRAEVNNTEWQKLYFWELKSELLSHCGYFVILLQKIIIVRERRKEAL